jgi:hypothetical protein
MACSRQVATATRRAPYAAGNTTNSVKSIEAGNQT